MSTAWNNELNGRMGGLAYVDELKGWSVLDTWYKDGGLQVVALKKDDNIVMAFRGTEPMKSADKGEVAKDWFNNINTYVLGLSVQTAGAKKIMKKVMKDNPGYNFFVAGYSLGGHLAYNVATEEIHYKSTAIKGIVTFNGLGLTIGLTLFGDVWDENQLTKKKSIIRNHMVEKDPVYNVWGTFHYGTTIFHEKSQYAPDEHSLYTFFDHIKRNPTSNGGGSW